MMAKEKKEKKRNVYMAEYRVNKAWGMRSPDNRMAFEKVLPYKSFGKAKIAACEHLGIDPDISDGRVHVVDKVRQTTFSTQCHSVTIYRQEVL
jgi:hypothetical protein